MTISFLFPLHIFRQLHRHSACSDVVSPPPLSCASASSLPTHENWSCGFSPPFCYLTTWVGKASVSGCPQSLLKSVHSPPSPEILMNFLYQDLLYLERIRPSLPIPSPGTLGHFGGILRTSGLSRRSKHIIYIPISPFYSKFPCQKRIKIKMPA